MPPDTARPWLRSAVKVRRLQHPPADRWRWSVGCLRAFPQGPIGRERPSRARKNGGKKGRAFQAAPGGQKAGSLTSRPDRLVRSGRCAQRAHSGEGSPRNALCFKDNSGGVLERGRRGQGKMAATKKEKWGALSFFPPGAAPVAARSHARDSGPRCRA